MKTLKEQRDEDEQAVSVPPEFEALAAQLEQEAHMLRELGRYGQRALGEGEDLVQALWDLVDRLGVVGDEIDRIAYRIDESA